jgi:hypothetical protein
MFNSRILNLSKRLFPRGRAFRIPTGSTIEKVLKGLAVSDSTAYSEAISVLNSILPDNDNFTAEDATNWERRLGLITVDGLDLEDRKLAIARKMQHPGSIKARQHYLYLQKQLRDAGFDVYVHENRVAQPVTSTIALGTFNLGEMNLGDVETNPFPWGVISPENYNAESFDVIANYLDPALDAIFLTRTYTSLLGEITLGEFNLGDLFDFDTALKSTFFIGGQAFGTVAVIQQARVTEFRQIVLRSKPAQTAGFSFLIFGNEDYNNDYNSDYNSQV